MKKLLLLATHLAMLALGFALGIYALPILIAPAPPSAAEIQSEVASARYTGQFRKELKDSDALHWGVGRIFINAKSISLEGELAPGPDYKLYLSPEFVETEADFHRLKPRMLRVGEVKTFKNFVVPLPADVDPARYNTVIVWCETFSQFISAAQYR